MIPIGIIASQIVQFVPVSTEPLFSLTQGIPGYTGNVVSINNGVSVQTFTFQSGTFISDINTFIAAGDGTRDITELFNQNGSGSFLPELTPPTIFNETDGSLSILFNGGMRMASNNSVSFTGNVLSAVAILTSGGLNAILGSPSGASPVNFAFLSFSNSGASSTMTVTDGLYDGNTAITDSRSSLETALLNTYSVINYRGCNPDSLVNPILGASPASSSSNPSAFNFNGRIKEIASYQSSSASDTEAFINSQITRNKIT